MVQASLAIDIRIAGASASSWHNMVSYKKETIMKMVGILLLDQHHTPPPSTMCRTENRLTGYSYLVTLLQHSSQSWIVQE
jgi:hypothetical protein